MKCKICGFDIVEGQENCSGCGTSIEELKQAGNIEYEFKEEVNAKVDEVETNKVEEVSMEENVEKPVEVVDSVPEETPVEEVSQENEINTIEPVVAETTIEPSIDTPSYVEEPIVSSEPIIMDQTNIEEPVTGEGIGEVTPVITPIEEGIVEQVPESQVEEAITRETAESESSVSEVPTQVVAETKKDKPKKKGPAKIIIAIVAIVLVVVIGCVLYIHFVLGSGYNVVSRTIKGLTNTVANNVDNSKKSSSSSVILNFITSGNEALDFLNKTKITLETNIDSQTGNADAYFGLTYNDNSKIDFDAVLDGKNLYLSSKDLYDKSVKISLDTEEFDNVLQSYKDTQSHQAEFKNIINTISSYITSEFNNLDFTKEYTKKAYDGKTKLVVKTTVELNKDDLTNITKNVIKKMQNDEQFLKNVALVSNLTVNEIKENLAEALGEVEYEDVTITISVYTDLTTTNFYSMDILIKKQETISNFSIEKMNSDYLIKLNIPNTLIVVINTNSKKMIITLSDEDQSFIINVDYNIVYSDSVSIKKVTESIDINEITSEDIEKIQNALLNNDIIKSVMNSYLSINNYDLDTSEADIEYDYSLNEAE